MNGALRRGLWAMAIGSIAVLAACGGDDSGGGQTPPPTTQVSSYGFEPYLQQVVEQSSCDTGTPVSTGANVSFVFAADQDMAEPRDLSAVTPGCKQ